MPKIKKVFTTHDDMVMRLKQYKSYAKNYGQTMYLQFPGIVTDTDKSSGGVILPAYISMKSSSGIVLNPDRGRKTVRKYDEIDEALIQSILRICINSSTGGFFIGAEITVTDANGNESRRVKKLNKFISDMENFKTYMTSRVAITHKKFVGYDLVVADPDCSIDSTMPIVERIHYKTNDVTRFHEEAMELSIKYGNYYYRKR